MTAPTNLWEILTEDHRKILIKEDIRFKEQFGYAQCVMYWFDRLSKKTSVLQMDIYEWRNLKNDLGFESIDDTYKHVFEKQLLNERPA